MLHAGSQLNFDPQPIPWGRGCFAHETIDEMYASIAVVFWVGYVISGTRQLMAQRVGFIYEAQRVNAVHSGKNRATAANILHLRHLERRLPVEFPDNGLQSL